MIRRVELITVADELNINNVIYTTETMERINERLNNYRHVPITVNFDVGELGSAVGRVIPKTSKFDGKKITVDIDVDEYWYNLLESDEYTVGSHTEHLKLEDKKIIPETNFDVISLQIIKNWRDK